MGDKKQRTHPKRIFISEVDGYSSGHIAKFLSTCIAGGASEDEEAETPAPTQGEPAFHVVGTVSSSNNEKTGFLLERYTVETDVLLTEEDFRKRRPHPAFRNHNNLEKLVLKLGKGPEELEYLSVSLRLDPFIIKDSFNLQWTSGSGMVENMESIVQEYKDTRQLLPIRICVVGPPSVGKTTVSEKLCNHYQIHHIKIKEVIEEKITQLKERVNGGDLEHVSEEESAAAREQLEKFNRSMEINRDEDTENQESMVKTPAYNKKITPDHVIALEASDDFLTKRVQELPESVAEKLRYTQDEFLPRLMRYRQLSTDDETLLDYFDELEIHPEHIEVTTDDPEYREVIKKITEMVGVPKNYGLIPEEQEEEDRKKEEEKKQKLSADAAEKKRRNEAALAEMAAQYEEWQKNLSEVRRQELELLEARSLPLRNYLMKYVMPSLTEAMSECCKIKPEDPVDFLAEYLLRHNEED
ncbi:hypothetical protein INR49_026298 [Caranx melampygus]|nr:hypothetical protein INR49_026298 [Caranx melampygus]